MKTLRSYCELVRLPNTFTAMADAMAGYWLVVGELRWTAQATCLVLASASLYSAGIVFNDVRDIETDRRERPQRPVASGKVGRRRAIAIGVFLAILGVALAGAAGFAATWDDAAPATLVQKARPLMVSCALLAAILAYDFLFKGTILGPLSMGICRGLNLLMAMSIGWWFSVDLGAVAIVAMIHYVASLTYFGRDEASRSARFRLLTGGIGVASAVLLLGVIVAGRTLTANAGANDTVPLILWLALLIHQTRIGYRAVKNPAPHQIQYAMKTFILGIIVFDAVIAASAVGWQAGLVILALLLPTLLIGRWVYST